MFARCTPCARRYIRTLGHIIIGVLMTYERTARTYISGGFCTTVRSVGAQFARNYITHLNLTSNTN